MKKILSKLLKVILLLVITTALAINEPSFADVGGVHRYNSSSSSSSRSSSSGDTFISAIPVNIIIVAVIAFVIIHELQKRGIINFGDAKDNTKTVAEQIRAVDPAFSEDNFLAWSKEVFIKLQNAWTKKDWKIIRPFESNELFEQHNSQLQDFINAGKTNIVERISVKNASLYSFTQDGDKDTLKITLTAVMRDYVIEDSTKNVLEGNPDEDIYTTYRLTFIRKTGVKTKVGTSNKSTTNCPNCGAPTNITSSGQCEYCGSVITTGEHDWVLSNLEGIS